MRERLSPPSTGNWISIALRPRTTARRLRKTNATPGLHLCLSAAEAAYQETLTLHRQLAQTNPTATLPDLATTLNNLAVVALAQSRLQHAAEWIREAVAIRRTLWQHDPATYGDVLAQSLAIEAVLLHETGAEPPAVCIRLHEAIRVVSHVRLTYFAHQSLRAWCGDTVHQEQR